MKKLWITLSITLALGFSIGNANAFTYNCKLAKNSDGNVMNGDDLRVTLTAKKISIKDTSENPTIDDSMTGKLDPNYSPRDNNANYVRFTYLTPVSEGYVNALVENKMMEGKPRGLMKLQWGGESFMQDLYSCSRAGFMRERE